MDLNDFKRRYQELRTAAEDVTNHLNQIARGRIHIDSLNIHYDLPEEAISYRHWHNRAYIFFGALVLGVTAVAFASLCESAYGLFRSAWTIHPMIPFAMTPVGLCLTRYIIERYFKGSEGSGVPQVVASLDQGGDVARNQLTLKIACGKVLGTCGGLVSGASLGREGPTIQIGAVILRTVYTRLKMPAIYTQRSLILAGGAAGVSAAFNTPIAGIVFAIEELGKAFYERETSVLILAIVVSGLIALYFSGPYHYFGEATAVVTSWAKMWAIPVGLVCGLSGGFLGRIIFKGTAILNKKSLSEKLKWTFLFGLLIASIGYLSGGESFGSGYEESRAMLEGKELTMLFPLTKYISTILSYFCGVPGGLFSPSLSIGAGIGELFSQFVNPEFAEAFILFGMVGFLSGVIRSPITSVIIVSEMTANHSIIFALLLCALVSYGSSRLVMKESLYHRLAQSIVGPSGEPSKGNS